MGKKEKGGGEERKKKYSIVSFENRVKYLIAIKTRNFIFPCTNTYRNHYSLYNISIIDRYSELHAIITREIYIKYHRNELQALNIHLFKQCLNTLTNVNFIKFARYRLNIIRHVLKIVDRE